MHRLLAVLMVVLAFWAGAMGDARAQSNAAGPARVQVSLVSNRTSVVPGEQFALALRQVIAPGWHTYWRNPGDAGEPPEMTWQLPEGMTVGAFEWPTPKTFTTTAANLTLVNYVYEGAVLLPMTATAPAAARPGDRLALSATVTWLVCDESTCVPEEAEVSLSLNVAADSVPDAAGEAAIAETRASLPTQWPGVTATIAPDGRLSVAGAALAALSQSGGLRNLYFFPISQSVLDHNAAQGARIGPQGVSFALTPQIDTTLGAQALEGVIGFEDPAGGGPRGLAIMAEPGPPLQGVDDAPAPGSEPPPKTRAASALTLPVALAFALLGGLILNLMPCVLPILSVKALGLVHGAQSGQARRHAALFFVGVMATFLLLAGLLIALQQGGAALGWGFQLQEPWFMGALALLFFLIGLNLLGAFEIGTGAQNIGAGLAGRGGDLGAFFTGALAVVAATPCTAPFMAGAMGFAASQPAAVSLLVFAALGLGFALPFTLLSFIPGFQKWIPKPGPWMDRFKQALAFPMFATAAWAAWVMTAQTGPDGFLGLAAVMVACAAIVWGFATFSGWRGRTATALVAALLVAAVAGVMRPLPYQEEPWSPQRVEELRAEGRTVFVNFTADWCVTCQANERLVLATPTVARALSDSDAVYLKADWTNRDALIAQTLAGFGRDGVPLYLVYLPNAPEPLILPQILTPQSVAAALHQQ